MEDRFTNSLINSSSSKDNSIAFSSIICSKTERGLSNISLVSAGVPAEEGCIQDYEQDVPCMLWLPSGTSPPVFHQKNLVG